MASVTDPVTVTLDDGIPYLAVDVQPDVVGGYFTLDSSRLDGPDVLLLYAAGTWLNIVCDVLSVDYQRGAPKLAGVLTATEAGTATVVLEDTAGQFDPMTNRELIHKGSPLRVRAWSTDDGTGTPWQAVLMTGTVGRIAVEYRREDPSLVTINVVDLIGRLASWESEGRDDPGVGAGDNLRQRALRILQETNLAGTLTTVTTTAVATPTPELTQAAQLIYDRLGTASAISEDWTWPGCPALVTTYADTLSWLRGTPQDVQAASLIYDRFLSTELIYEDWTWPGCPPVVNRYNGVLLALWAGVGTASSWLSSYGRTSARTWLGAYITATTPPAAGASVTTVTGAAALSTASDTLFAATLLPTVLAKPWAELQAAVEAELGRVWVNRDDQLVVLARGSELSGPVRGTLSDTHGEALTGVHCCIGSALPVYSPENLTNRVVAGRRQLSAEKTPQVLARRDDPISQNRYGVSAVDRRNLELYSDAQVAPWAEAIITGNTTPELRVDTVVPQPAPDDLASALAAWPAVAATDVGDRWLFRCHTYGGRLVEQVVGVLGVVATLTPEEWSFTWTTALAPDTGFTIAAGWFVLGVSVLDASDMLAPFSVPVT